MCPFCEHAPSSPRRWPALVPGLGVACSVALGCAAPPPAEPEGRYVVSASAEAAATNTVRRACGASAA